MRTRRIRVSARAAPRLSNHRKTAAKPGVAPNPLAQPPHASHPYPARPCGHCAPLVGRVLSACKNAQKRC